MTVYILSRLSDVRDVLYVYAETYFSMCTVFCIPYDYY